MPFVSTVRGNFGPQGTKGGRSKATLSGGTQTTAGAYFVRTFTGTGNLTVVGGPITVDYLLVGGGGTGGDGNANGGGGGAGSMIEHNSYTLATGTHTVTIGGASQSISPGSNNDSSVPTSPGNTSSFSASGASALGGGRGGTYAGSNQGQAGGSGGGGGGPSGSTGAGGANVGTTPSGASGFANSGAGWTGGGSWGYGGGGGGAGGAGQSGGSSGSGYGPGRANSISGSSVEYARGGHGAYWSFTPAYTSTNSTYGAGANGTSDGGNFSGNAGVFVVRYLTADATA